MFETNYNYVPGTPGPFPPVPPYPPMPIPPCPPGLNVLIDTTLTVSGTAADSKVTGDVLKDKVDKESLEGKSVKLVGNKVEIAGYLDAEENLVPSKNETGITWVDVPRREEFDELVDNVTELAETVTQIAEDITHIDYSTLENKPTINGVEVEGEKNTDDFGLQQKLIAGKNIEIKDNGDGTSTISSIGGGGAGGELEADLEVSNPLGRYAMNDVIEAGTAFESIFRGLLSKAYNPTLTDPSVSINYNVPALVKVGVQVARTSASLNFNRGSINPKYSSESSYRSGPASAFTVNLTGADISYNDSNSTGAFTVPAFTKSSTGTVTFSGTVAYSAGVQPKNSDGENYSSPLPAGSKSASKVIEFILPFYWGVSATNEVANFTGLREDLTKKGNKTYNYTTRNEYVVIAYDASYGDLKSILDQNGFETISGYNKNILTIEGQRYFVWVSNLPSTDTDAPSTFKF